MSDSQNIVYLMTKTDNSLLVNDKIETRNPIAFIQMIDDLLIIVNKHEQDQLEVQCYSRNENNTLRNMSKDYLRVESTDVSVDMIDNQLQIYSDKDYLTYTLPKNDLKARIQQSFYSWYTYKVQLGLKHVKCLNSEL